MAKEKIPAPVPSPDTEPEPSFEDSLRATLESLKVSQAAVKQLEQAQQVPEEDSPSIVGDIATQAFVGFGAAITETIGFFANPLLQGEQAQSPLRTGPDGRLIVDRTGPISASRLGFPEPETIPGALSRGVSQFTTGFIGTGKLTILSKLGKAQYAVRGALADFLAFNEHEPRVSDLLTPYGVPLTDMLKSDTSDSAIEGRLKNALEGTAIGAGLGLVFAPMSRFIKRVREARRLKEQGRIAEARRLEQEAIKDFENSPAGQIEEVIDETGQTVLRPKQIDPEVKPLAPDEMLRESLKAERPRLLDEATARKIQERISSGARNIDELAGINLNLKRLMGELDSLDPIEALKAIQEDIGPIRQAEGRDLFFETESLAETLRKSQDIASKDIDGAVGTLRQLVTNNQDLPATVTAVRSLLRTYAEEVTRLADVVGKEGSTSADLAEFIKVVGKLGDTYDVVTGASKLTGRTLSAHRIFAQAFTPEDLSRARKSPSEALTKELDSLIKQAGGAQKIKKVAENILKTGKPTAGGIRKESSALGRAWDKLVWYWMNNILSGPKTHLVNIQSNLVQNVLLPLQRSIGGLALGNADEALKGVRQVYGAMLAVQDAARAAGRSLKTGDSIFQKQKMDVDMDPGIASKWARRIFGAPGKLLQTEDEFFRVMAFRGYMYADIMKEASEQGLKGADLKAWMSKRLDEATANPEQFENALRFANEANFTADLPKGTLGANLMKLARDHPYIRLIIPFVRTPTNILTQMGQHVPLLPVLSSNFRAALRGSKGTDFQAVVVGRQITGLAFVTSVWALKSEGLITGSGPLDPEQRAAWMNAGNRPFSLKVRGEWLPLDRLDPWGSLLGLTATAQDTIEQLKKALETDGTTQGKLEAEKRMVLAAEAAWKGVTRTILDKSYFTGIREVVSALERPDRFGDYALQISSGAIPYSQTLAQITRSIHGEIRRQETFLDLLRNRSLGLALPPPKRGISGEPIFVGHDEGLLPGPFFASTEDDDDPVLNELAELPGGIEVAPPEKIGKITLPREAHDRWWELQGKVPLNGKTLKEQLAEDFASKDYQDLPTAENIPVGFEAQSPRRQWVQQRFTEYRLKARNEMLKDFPDLKRQVIDERVINEGVRSGRTSGQVSEFLQSQK